VPLVSLDVCVVPCPAQQLCTAVLSVHCSVLTPPANTGKHTVSAARCSRLVSVCVRVWPGLAWPRAAASMPLRGRSVTTVTRFDISGRSV